METNDKIFLENILKLTTELDGVEGFEALLTVDEIELLFENYKNELIQYLKKELEYEKEYSCNLKLNNNQLIKKLQEHQKIPYPTPQQFKDMWDSVKDDRKINSKDMCHSEIFRAGNIWMYHFIQTEINK